MADFAASRRIQQEKMKLTKVLISTGDATGTTEIIDLVNNEDASCENLQYDYPIPTRDGITDKVNPVGTLEHFLATAPSSLLR